MPAGPLLTLVGAPGGRAEVQRGAVTCPRPHSSICQRLQPTSAGDGDLIFGSPPTTNMHRAEDLDPMGELPLHPTGGGP